MKITAPRITKVLKEDRTLDETLLLPGEDLAEYSFRNPMSCFAIVSGA